MGLEGSELSATGSVVTGAGAAPPAATGVLSVTAGAGISVTGPATAPVVGNTGVLSVGAGGAGISVTGPATAPVVNNTGVVSVNGQTGAVTINPVATLDGIATGTAQLSTLASATLTAGALAYVVSVGDVWRLQQSALTVDGITVVAATGKAGYQWARLLQPNPANAFVSTWSVDPVAGNDENAGTTDATACKTLQEIKRRIWGLELQTAPVIRILADTATTDVGNWHFSIAAAVGGGAAVGRLVFLGVLGPSTGPGSTAHDNTIYSGSLTSAPVVPANVPSVDDYQLTDSAIPVSYTASGMLAAGVIFKRTSSTARYWYAVKDLGSKTIRISNPISANGVSTWFALASGDTYSAYQMPKIYGQIFPGGLAQFVQYDSLYDLTVATQETAQSVNTAMTRLRNWVGTAGRILVVGFQAANCMIATSGGQMIASTSTGADPKFSGGAFLGTGATTYQLTGQTMSMTGCVVFQGAAISSNDIAAIELEGGSFAFHDCTVPCIQAFANARICYQPGGLVGTGISGKGNTSKLVKCTAGGSFYYGLNSATPPFNAGSTSDASPIQIGAASYTVAQLPAASDTVLAPLVFKATLP